MHGHLTSKADQVVLKTAVDDNINVSVSCMSLGLRLEMGDLLTTTVLFSASSDGDL